MDTTKDNLADTMAELREALRDLKTEEITNTGAVSGSGAYADTITLSGTGLYNNSTVIGGGYTVGTGMNFPNNVSSVSAGPFTVNSGLTYTNGSWGATNLANPITTNGTGQLNLNGDEADIVINGVSLMDLLRDRLNIMIPNPKLEKEWNELKELGDQYRALEAKLKEQGEMWAKLKQMPPPDPLY